MGSMFTLFPILFMLVFVLVFGFILGGWGKAIAQSRKNAASPRVTASVTLVAKRYAIRGVGTEAHMNGMRNLYYLAFEFESGDRMEFSVPAEVYGVSVEGDRGKLCFQGTKFISFERG